VNSFKSVSYSSGRPGPRLIVLGAVHGNEVCGSLAIGQVMAMFDAGEIALDAGRVTFVPVTNSLAYAKKTRAGDRNLNRDPQPTDAPREFEDVVANWLCPLLASHDVLLDLHSFQGEGEPFVFIGPENNQGKIEPFRHAELEEALALRLGVGRCVTGWLSTYATGVEHRQKAANLIPTQDASTGVRYGIGTTEYMRSVGGWALTLEWGQHDDPLAVEVGRTAVLNSLTHLGLLSGASSERVSHMQTLQLCEVVDRHDADDRFARGWRSFDALQRGEVIGTRADGSSVVAPFDGFIVFPSPNASVATEWFYLAKQSDRLTRLDNGVLPRRLTAFRQHHASLSLDRVQLRDRGLPLDHLGLEANLVANLEALEHLLVGNLEAHRHRRHRQVRNVSVPEDDETRGWVELAHLAVNEGHQGSSGCRSRGLHRHLHRLSHRVTGASEE
jgi:predicted deacylase